MNNQLQELLQLLRVRTPMYIGTLSIIRFAAFLDGYFFAIYHENNNDEMSKCMGMFTGWLAKEYSITASLGWDSILLRITENDDEAALDLFWKKWSEFCEISEDIENKTSA